MSTYPPIYYRTLERVLALYQNKDLPIVERHERAIYTWTNASHIQGHAPPPYLQAHFDAIQKLYNDLEGGLNPSSSSFDTPLADTEVAYLMRRENSGAPSNHRRLSGRHSSVRSVFEHVPEAGGNSVRDEDVSTEDISESGSVWGSDGTDWEDLSGFDEPEDDMYTVPNAP